MLSLDLIIAYDNGPVHPAYNPSFSACFYAETMFFSHNKSANSIF
jgi:hypothetical protein